MPDQRLAVVTGGSRGIGRAIAQRFVNDGFECIVTGRDSSAPLIPGAAFHAVDFDIPEKVAGFAEFLEDSNPDVLVNNVGLNLSGLVDRISPADLDRLYTVNLRTPFLLCQAVMPSMKMRGWGRIINITSLRSRLGRAADAPFCAMKFGLDGLTAALGAEGAPSNVLVNAVAPGYISNEAMQSAFTSAQRQSIARAIPAGRLGTVEEVAALVAWLASGENSYVCGQNISVDGGLSRSHTQMWFAPEE